VRISERWLGQPNSPMIAAVAKLADDKNWNVRRQVGASLGEMAGPARVDTAVSVLVKDGADPIVTDAGRSGLKDVEPDAVGRVLQAKAPTGAAQQPVDAVTMLSAAIAKAGDAAAAQKAIDVAADAAQPMWQRKAILQGLDAGLPAPGAGGAGRGGRGGGGR